MATSNWEGIGKMFEEKLEEMAFNMKEMNCKMDKMIVLLTKLVEKLEI